MWFNPAEIRKSGMPPVAIPAIYAIPSHFQEDDYSGIAEIAKIATAQELKSEILQIKPETPKDRNYEESRQKAIALMNESPDTPRGIYVDEVIDPFSVVVFVASRATQQTCWLTIRRDKYDPFKLLELIERLGK